MTGGGFSFPTEQESKVIFANDANILSAKATLTGSGSGIRIWLGLADTANGTYTWEEAILVDNISNHTFTATGKFLKWKLVGVKYTLTRLEVEVTTA